jgi:serine/threonine protein phosphatase 1
VVFAVGDIHGRLDLLEGASREIRRLAAEAAKKGRRAVAIFLGDYIDRGPAAAGVIAHLTSLRGDPNCQMRFLRGNHEQFLLDFMDGDGEAWAWLDNGGAQTLLSYGVDWRDCESLVEAARAAIPAEHLAFLRQTEMGVECGGYFFVHAGLRPGRPLSEQTNADMLWLRYAGDERPAHGKTVVHGHTPRARPTVGRWRIDIDTGAWMSGALTLARFEDAQVRLFKVEIASPGGSAEVSEWEACA